MNTEYLLQQAKLYVKTKFEGAESGHDWWHIARVYQSAMQMADEMHADKLIVGLAALLHDIGDSKFNGGDETAGPKEIRDFLEVLHLHANDIEKVLYIVENMSFRHSFSFEGEKSLEFCIVQDADRLDAMGAIGIARAFSYGGYKGRPFFDPSIPPQIPTDKGTYQKSTAPTINHFYEKLLLLKDQMNTAAGKKRAELRHSYMLGFLEQFEKEWQGDA